MIEYFNNVIYPIFNCLVVLIVLSEVVLSVIIGIEMLEVMIIKLSRRKK